jgi:hypothetical protein
MPLMMAAGEAAGKSICYVKQQSLIKRSYAFGIRNIGACKEPVVAGAV